MGAISQWEPNETRFPVERLASGEVGNETFHIGAEVPVQGVAEVCRTNKVVALESRRTALKKPAQGASFLTRLTSLIHSRGCPDSYANPESDLLSIFHSSWRAKTGPGGFPAAA